MISEGIANYRDIRIVDSVKEAVGFKPDILGISAVGQVISDAVGFVRQVKEKINPLTVLGGHYVTTVPDKMPFDFDIGVLSEGEVTLAEIVRSCHSNLT